MKKRLYYLKDKTKPVKMAKKIDLKTDNTEAHSEISKRIYEKSAQQDLNEKIRGNKRKTKWDNLLYFTTILVIMNACGIIHIDLPAISPLAIKIFQYVSKINSS